MNLNLEFLAQKIGRFNKIALKTQIMFAYFLQKHKVPLQNWNILRYEGEVQGQDPD